VLRPCCCVSNRPFQDFKIVFLALSDVHVRYFLIGWRLISAA
jgi:hypothetical protein